MGRPMRWVWLGWSGRREGEPSTLQENRAHRQTRVLRCHHHRLFGRVPRSGRARGSSPWQLAPGRSAGAGPAPASVRGRQRWLPSPGSSPGTASLAGQELGLVALGSREAVRPQAARRPPPPHHWAHVGDALPHAGGPGDGVTPWNQLGPGRARGGMRPWGGRLAHGCQEPSRVVRGGERARGWHRPHPPPQGSYLRSPATRVPCNVPLSCLAAPLPRPRRGLCVNRPQVSH